MYLNDFFDYKIVESLIFTQALKPSVTDACNVSMCKNNKTCNLWIAIKDVL